MNSFIETLLKYKKSLLSLEEQALQWAKEEGVLFAFHSSGDLIAIITRQVCLTTDGSLSSETYWDGTKKDILSGESTERAFLSFVPASLTFEKYKHKPHQSYREFPLPKDFLPEAIQCQGDIFTIFPQSNQAEQAPLCGTFSVFCIALSMIESLYLMQGVSEEIIQKCYYELLPEDHQNYLTQQEKEQKRIQKRVFASQSPFIKAEDFSVEDSVYTWEGDLPLWESKADLYFEYTEPEEAAEPAFEAVLQLLNQSVTWIEEHKTEIFYAILEDDMAALACDWMDGVERVEQDGKTYYVKDNGDLFPYPVTNQSLYNSLYLEGMNAYYYEKHEKNNTLDHIMFDMFFGTEPDFFACHSIEVFLTIYSDGRYEIKINGLAG